MKRLLRITFIFFSFYTAVFAADLEIKVNQKPVKLPYWSADDPHYGGIIVIRGGDPVRGSDTLNLFASLLSKNGWSTVLLNCSPEITIPWLTQLPEVISALRQAQNKRIVVIHYGEQLNMVLDYFSKPQGKGINGLVLLSAFDNKESTIKADSIRFPIFDIYGQFDYDDVESQAVSRAKTFKSPTYLSMELPGADHEYNYAQNWLVSFLTGWILKIPETETAAPPINSKKLQPVRKSYIEPIYSLESHLVAINN
jgi:hypothetical protein